MNREQADRTIARLQDVQQRIERSLLDLENEFGYQLLSGATLTGETGRRWAETQSRVTVLWRLYDAFLVTVNRAVEVRARRARPGDEELAELADLLTGVSVEPAGAEIPLAHRTLLGPTTERMTVDVAVQRMDAAYSAVVAFVAEADAARNALQPGLDAVDGACATLREVRAAAGEGMAADLAAADREVDAARAAAYADPLTTPLADLERVAARVGQLAVRAQELAGVRETHAARVAAARASLDALAAREDDAGRSRTVVEEKIVAPGLPAIPAAAATLRGRLGDLAVLAEQERWTEFATAAKELTAAVAAADAALARTRENVDGLLARRDELRGRLRAYQARAARLGFAEHPQVTALHDAAHDLLWSAPCDLRRATVALSTYVKALNDGTEPVG